MVSEREVIEAIRALTEAGSLVWNADATPRLMASIEGPPALHLRLTYSYTATAGAHIPRIDLEVSGLAEGSFEAFAHAGGCGFPRHHLYDLLYSLWDTASESCNASRAKYQAAIRGALMAALEEA